MLTSFPEAIFNINPSSLLIKEAEILILAGPGRSLNERNCPELKVKLIAEGANIAYENNELRNLVHQKGIASIPGIIANSGGVISSYEEWALENENRIHISLPDKWERVKKSIEQRIHRNIQELCARMKVKKDLSSYDCALEMATKRLEDLKSENRKVRQQTKAINSELEHKFSVFTK